MLAVFSYIQFSNSIAPSENDMVSAKPGVGRNGTFTNIGQKASAPTVENYRNNDPSSVVHATNLRMKTLHGHSRLRERETINATDVAALRIMFDITESNIVKNEGKQLFIRVIAPDGDLLGDNDHTPDTLVNLNGKAIAYSATKEVMFTPDETITDVSVDIDNKDSFEKGSYNIEIYNDDGYKVGSGSISLQ